MDARNTPPLLQEAQSYVHSALMGDIWSAIKVDVNYVLVDASSVQIVESAQSAAKACS